MAFDFSSFGGQPTAPAPTTPNPMASSPLSQQGDTNFTNEISYLQNGVNQGNQGWDQALTNAQSQQKQYEQLVSDPANKQYFDQINAVKTADPSAFEKTRMYTDTDGNTSGDPIANENYDPKLTAARDWLTQNGMLNYNPANTGQGNTPGYFSAGSLSPLGSDVWSKDGATGVSNPKNGGWLVQTPQEGTGHSLINSSQQGDDSMWGKITNEANVKDDHANDLFWKIAPMLPMVFATIMSGGAMAPLLAEMPEAGGATAGALVGDQTAGMFGGALNSGTGATAGGLLDSASPWLSKSLPNTIKSSISSLNSGKFNPTSTLTGLAGSAIGASGIMPDMPSWAMPAISAGMNVAKGGGFDWSKYLIPLAMKGLN